VGAHNILRGAVNLLDPEPAYRTISQREDTRSADLSNWGALKKGNEPNCHTNQINNVVWPYGHILWYCLYQSHYCPANGVISKQSAQMGSGIFFDHLSL
jgi:hypothetical protein